MVVADRPVLVRRRRPTSSRRLRARTSPPATSRPRASRKGNPLIKAGSKVKIDGIGTSFGGTYVVSSCTHLFQGTHGYRTHLLDLGPLARAASST